MNGYLQTAAAHLASAATARGKMSAPPGRGADHDAATLDYATHLELAREYRKLAKIEAASTLPAPDDAEG